MEITGKYAEITWLKEKSHSSEMFTPKTKDIDYKDYEDPEDDLSKNKKIYDGMHVSSGQALCHIPRSGPGPITQTIFGFPDLADFYLTSGSNLRLSSVPIPFIFNDFMMMLDRQFWMKCALYMIYTFWTHYILYEQLNYGGSYTAYKTERMDEWLQESGYSREWQDTSMSGYSMRCLSIDHLSKKTLLLEATERPEEIRLESRYLESRISHNQKISNNST
ncbi:hypothetical protein C8R48DRAFT_669227 [Suillus tomentosus]|nr:hypothetical protein C8R48DRAFT_669227 [Suillus tomentosus]